MSTNPPKTDTAPVKIEAEVGSKLLFEDDRVKVWDLALEPGKGQGMHQHENDYYLVIIGDGTLKSVNSDGSTRFVKDMNDGDVFFRPVEDKDVHDAVNVGDGPWRNLVIEMKR